MTEYPAGTVAVATVSGQPNVRVMRTPVGWMTAGGDAGRWLRSGVDPVTDVRPLVVLDLGPVKEHLVGTDGERVQCILAHLRDDPTLAPFADQIEAQTKPPRIPEPGLWGVVEASFLRAYQGKRLTFLRDVTGTDDDWQALTRVSTDGNRGRYDWASLIDPTLVRPGIEDAS